MQPEMQDPICGMPLQMDSPFFAEHGGQLFRFCSALCCDAFVRDPARVRSATPAGLVPTDERTIAYFSMEIALEPRMQTSGVPSDRANAAVMGTP